MTSFKVTVAYDGTGFVGWQRQASGTSVQGLLEDALRHLDERDVTVVGAGRTDAGVHALGQVASFTIDRVIDPATLVRAMNARLPSAVRVVDASAVDAGFHARFNATRKIYRYRLWLGEAISPFERAYVWQLTGALDVDAMSAAASLVEGRRDFAAFQAAGSSTASTVREVVSSRFTRADRQARDEGLLGTREGTGELVSYEIAGDGFLRHMVRNIVGSLVEIGRGRRPIEWMTDILEQRTRALAGPTAPPCGLVLLAVEYGLQSRSAPADANH